MRKSISGIGVFALLSTVLCLGVAEAAPFESDFQVVKASGGCTARLPRESAFVNLVEGQRLPYGTVIKTEADGSAVIRLSAGNGCRISASTTVGVTQDPANKAVVLKLTDQGYIRAILDKGFRSTDQLKVETPSATCEALHCDFSVEYKIIGDLKTSIISCTEGEIAVIGENFSMADLTAGEQVTIAQSPDGKFVRLKIVQGDVMLAIIDSDGAQKMVSLTAGDEVQILSEESSDKPGMTVVIYKIDYADPAKKPELVQAEVARKLAVSAGPAGQLPPEKEWPLLTVTAPLPECPSCTPVGIRN